MRKFQGLIFRGIRTSGDFRICISVPLKTYRNILTHENGPGESVKLDQYSCW